MKCSYSSDIFTRLHAKDAKDNVLVGDDTDGLKYRVFSSSSSRTNQVAVKSRSSQYAAGSSVHHFRDEHWRPGA